MKYTNTLFSFLKVGQGSLIKIFIYFDLCRTFSSPKRLLSGETLVVYSSYFTDLNSDCIPELMVFVSDDQHVYGFLILNEVSVKARVEHARKVCLKAQISHPQNCVDLLHSN